MSLTAIIASLTEHDRTGVIQARSVDTCAVERRNTKVTGGRRSCQPFTTGGVNLGICSRLGFETS